MLGAILEEAEQENSSGLKDSGGKSDYEGEKTERVRGQFVFERTVQHVMDVKALRHYLLSWGSVWVM